MSEQPRFRQIQHEEVQELINQNENKNTKKSHKVWANIFQQYLKDVKETKAIGNLLNLEGGVQSMSLFFILFLESMTYDEVSIHLQHFFFQVKKKDGEDYKGGSLRTGINSLIAFLSSKGHDVDINQDAKLYKIIDARLKMLAKDGMDETEHATPLTEEQEKRLIASFDTNTPFGLTCYVWYYICKYTAARGGYAHIMHFKEISQCRNEHGQDYFEIFIPVEKNNQRGLRPGQARKVMIPPGAKCIPFIRKYMMKRPEGAFKR